MTDPLSLALHPTQAELDRIQAMLELPAEPAAFYRRLRRKQNLALTRALAAGSLCPVPFDAGALAQSVFCAAKEVCPFPFRNLQLTCAREVLPVLADPDALCQVLLGLLCNSFLYGGKSPLIRLRIVRQRDRAVLELRDWGWGLSEKLHAPHAGGIVLARLLARAFGGCFVLDSAPGKGVRAVLSLPLCGGDELHPVPSAQQLLSDPLSPVFVQLSPRCILPDG